MSRAFAVGVVVVAIGCGPSVKDDGASGGDTAQASATDATSPGSTSTGTVPTSAGPGSTSTAETGVAVTTSPSATVGSEGGSTTGAADCGPEDEDLQVLACVEVASPSPLLAHQGFVYYSDGTSIFRIPVEGDADPQVMVEDAGDVRALVAANEAVYWAGFDTGVVGSLDLGTLQTATLLEGLQKPNSLAVDTSWLYATTYELEGVVMRVPTAGGAPEVLYEGLDHPGHLIVDGETLYWAMSLDNGNVYAPIYRGTTGLTAPEVIDGAEGSVHAMFLEGELLYWARYDLPQSLIGVTFVGAQPGWAEIAVLADQPEGLVPRGDTLYGTAATIDGHYLWSVPKTGETITQLAPVDAFGLTTTPRGLVFYTEGALVLLP